MSEKGFQLFLDFYGKMLIGCVDLIYKEGETQANLAIYDTLAFCIKNSQDNQRELFVYYYRGTVQVPYPIVSIKFNEDSGVNDYKFFIDENNYAEIVSFALIILIDEIEDNRIYPKKQLTRPHVSEIEKITVKGLKEWIETYDNIVPSP